jgi:hypothetical protein
MFSPFDLILAEKLFVFITNCLGNLPRCINKGDSEVYFVDALVSTPSFVTDDWATPTPNEINMNVEVIMNGIDLDDCLLISIRRIFEEIGTIKMNPLAICSPCRILTGVWREGRIYISPLHSCTFL